MKSVGLRAAIALVCLSSCSGQIDGEKMEPPAFARVRAMKSPNETRVCIDQGSWYRALLQQMLRTENISQNQVQ